MKVNIIFESVKVYDVQGRLDVVIGQEFMIEVLDVEAMGPLELFSNRDPVLAIDSDGTHANAMSLGESTLRFMEGSLAVKDLVISVVNATSANATTLGGSLSEPVNK